MQVFLASDVLYGQRFVPSIQETLKDEDLAGEVRVPRRSSCPTSSGSSPSFVADQMSRIRTGSGGGRAAAPGLHGNGLGSGLARRQALTPGGSATIPLSDDLLRRPGGEPGREHRDRRGGPDHGRPRGRRDRPGGDPRHDRRRRDQDRDGPPRRAAPTGQNVPITVARRRGAGREKTDNNKQTSRSSSRAEPRAPRYPGPRGRPHLDAGHRGAGRRRGGPRRADLGGGPLHQAAPAARGPAHGARPGRRARPRAPRRRAPEAFVQLRDWVEETAAGLESVRRGRAAHGRLHRLHLAGPLRRL